MQANHSVMQISLALLCAVLLLGGCSSTPQYQNVTVAELTAILEQHEHADVQPTWWYLGTDQGWHYFDTQYPYKIVAPPSFWGTQTHFRVADHLLDIPDQEPFGEFAFIDGRETKYPKRFRKIFYRWTDETPRKKEYDITYTSE